MNEEEIAVLLRSTEYKENIRAFIEMLKVIPIDNTRLEPTEVISLFEGKVNYYTAGIVFSLVGKIRPKEISDSYQVYLGLMAKAKRMQRKWESEAQKLIKKNTQTQK